MRFILLITGLLSLQTLRSQEDIKVLTYNLMLYRSTIGQCDYSNNDPAQKEDNLKTVIQYADPDVVVFQEIGNSQGNILDLLDNSLNTDGETKYTYTTYAGSSSLINHCFFNENKIGYIGHNSIERGINNEYIVRLIDAYRFYYKDPSLASGADTTYFTVFAAHFKAGQGGQNPDDRHVAAEAIMEYVRDNDLQNFMLAGDLNVYAASEPAYQQLTDFYDASYNFNDPTGIEGAWNNNNSGNFSLVHTQSTHTGFDPCFSGGGMDDRFDFILLSNSIMDNSNYLEYESYSYRVIGQDGNRFNSSVVSPSNADVSLNVANALYRVSDHLPVVVTLKAHSRDPSSTQELKFNKHFIKIQNPVRNKALTIRSSYNRQTTATLYDLTGRKIQDINITPGVNNIHLDSKTKKGNYILKINKKGLTPFRIVII